MTCAFADPKEWLLEITPAIQAQFRKQSQVYATPNSRWLAYMNQICLHTFLNWTTEDSIQTSVWQSFPGTTAFWEFVNGTAILLEGRRVVLIPSEAIDDSELEIPQEWVDIPSWAADYFLAVQVKPDGDWVRIWGYITHAELKSKGNYDYLDRTYCIDSRYVTKDFNAFWITYQFCQREKLKATIPLLPKLPDNQAEKLLQRLSSSSITFPRLAVPFTTWGSLLENERWRQHLYQKRQQLASSQQPVNLSLWLEGIYNSVWETVETFFRGTNYVMRRATVYDGIANFRDSSAVGVKSIKRGQLIDLGIGVPPIVLVVDLVEEDNQQIYIRVQVHPTNENPYLSSNIKLVLLSESGEIIQSVQAREQDNYIQLNRFQGEVGEYFQIQVGFDDYQITETFVI
jgi:Protein of unknown function (DUF1822)